MQNSLPVEIQRCFELGALRLGRALEVLEWPAGGKDAAPAEINALINVMYYLSSLPRPFQIYAEGTCASGRMDMMGYDGETAIAIEAKNFGAINRQAGAVLDDLERLRNFVPVLPDSLRNGAKPTQWWHEAKARWGIVLISSFRGREIADAWTSKGEAEFVQKMSEYSNHSEHAQSDATGAATGFFKLYQAFEQENRGAAIITPGDRWKDCGAGWFLWGAIPL